MTYLLDQKSHRIRNFRKTDGTEMGRKMLVPDEIALILGDSGEGSIQVQKPFKALVAKGQ